MKGIYIFKKWKDGFLYPSMQINSQQLMSYWSLEVFIENKETIKSVVKMNFLNEHPKVTDQEFDKNFKILFDI